MLNINLANLVEVGENVQAGMMDDGDKKYLVIVLDTSVNLGPSSTGKMTGTGNTSGFKPFPGGMFGNVYIGKKVRVA